MRVEWEFSEVSRASEGVGGDLPSLRSPSRLVGGTLTDGHVVAAVREAGVPVAELGLVAAAGALGLTGHWVGHGCGGRGQGSAGSLAAPSGSPHPFRPSLCRAVRAGPPGRPLRGHHCAPLPFCHIRASTPRSVLLRLPPAHLVELGMGGSRTSGQECVTRGRG